MIEKDFLDMERRLEPLFRKSIAEKAFPGAALGFSFRKNNELQRKIYFFGSPDGSKRSVDKKTLYDLASLTKPLVTVLSLLALMSEKKIDWKVNLQSLLPSISEEKRNISIFQLMSHCSGFPAYKPYYEKLKTVPFNLRKEKIIEYILQEDLISSPGTKGLYSDLGYILLGYIIEKITGKTLDDYWKKKIALPLSLQKEIIFPTKEDRKKRKFASTGIPVEEENSIVHDENSRMIGGVSGHAGLFGTADGVLDLCENILLQWHNLSSHPSYSNKDLRDALKRNKDEQWTPGFDTPSPFGSSSGKYFSRCSVGHLGFTGTSFWIDLEKSIVIVLLTNRVFWGIKNNKIRELRPVIHDLIMKQLLFT
jgi:CubicO group peptidase (beta-lactamase class C family)